MVSRGCYLSVGMNVEKGGREGAGRERKLWTLLVCIVLKIRLLNRGFE